MTLVIVLFREVVTIFIFFFIIKKKGGAQSCENPLRSYNWLDPASSMGYLFIKNCSSHRNSKNKTLIKCLPCSRHCTRYCEPKKSHALLFKQTNKKSQYSSCFQRAYSFGIHVKKHCKFITAVFSVKGSGYKKTLATHTDPHERAPKVERRQELQSYPADY